MTYENPPGLTIVENFISNKEEKILANLIDWDRKPESKHEGIHVFLRIIFSISLKTFIQ